MTDLGQLIPISPDPDAVMDAFLGWVEAGGLTLYPHQEEALLEIVSGAHVIVDTPTGSGKSLIAVAAHFAALADRRRSFYTAPIKALVSEKFFDLAATFGADEVGMLTGTTKEQGLTLLEKSAAELLPADYTLDYAGESRQLRQEGSTLVGVLAIALLFVYFVLAIQFNSFRDPLVVLLGSVPLALAGALLFPFLGWTTINIYSQIGFITLVGLIAKNAILIVEFANHLQSEGFSKLEAIKNAAETRLRPVLMTTAATALGHFPLILVSGAGAEARNSIGIILVAGMVIGTVFTLFVLPCVYLLLAKTHRQGEVDPEHDAEVESSISYG